MNKRWIAALVMLLVVLLSAYYFVKVQAQSGGTSADQPSAAVTTRPPAEEAPGSHLTDGSLSGSSSSETGMRPPRTQAPVEELPPGSDASISSQAIAPQADWNKTVRYAGSTLRPRNSGVSYVTNGSGSCVYVTGGSAAVVWNAPLTLPEGAQVSWIRMYFYDNDSANNTDGWFTKYDLYGGLVNEWKVSSADGGNGYRDVQIDPVETIDYDSYSYVINWRPMAANVNIQLCGFRIFYLANNFTTFLPTVKR